MLSDQSFLNIAAEIATHATCSRLQVGAVLVRDNRAFAHGYNGAPAGELHCDHEGSNDPCTTSVHAEVNALISAARIGVSTVDAWLYLTHAPCKACAGLIINAGVKGVTYSNLYRETSGITRLIDAKIGALHRDPETGVQGIYWPARPFAHLATAIKVKKG